MISSFIIYSIKLKPTFLHCSCYGQVTSLNGEAEQGIIVEAMGEGEGCSLFQEESKTDQEGLYRIRGLQVSNNISSGNVIFRS